ncbi:DNA-binding winged helix-turn-helix (wHTH) protein [Bradyrhizobium sp. F1.13.1]
MRTCKSIRNRPDQMDLVFGGPGSKARKMKLTRLQNATARPGLQGSSVQNRWDDEMKVLLADVAGVPVLVRFLFQESPVQLSCDVRSLLSRREQKRREEQPVRPSSLPNETLLRVGSLQLDLVEHNATREDRPIDLRPREYQLLKYMMQRHDEILTREALLKDVWHYKFVPETNLVDVHMSRLRRKIDGASDWSMIRNVRGVGFVLSGTPLAQESAPIHAGRSTVQRMAEHLRSDEKGDRHVGR